MRNPLKRLLSRLQHHADSYTCKQCGYVFLKKDAQVSGWVNHPYGFHVHCPRAAELQSTSSSNNPLAPERSVKVKRVVSYR